MELMGLRFLGTKISVSYCITHPVRESKKENGAKDFMVSML